MRSYYISRLRDAATDSTERFTARTVWRFTEGLPGPDDSGLRFADLAEGLSRVTPATMVMLPDAPFFAVEFETPTTKAWRIFEMAAGRYVPGTYITQAEAAFMAQKLCDLQRFTDQAERAP